MTSIVAMASLFTAIWFHNLHAAFASFAAALAISQLLEQVQK